MNKEICIVVQGATHAQWLQTIKEGWKGYRVIYSTWEGTNPEHYDESDIVLYNPIPEAGVRNLNLQRVSSLNGFLKAKEMGFKRVLKWRSDFYCPNPKLFLETFEIDKLNFYAWHVVDHYVMDFFMEGDVDDMIQLFTFDNWNAVPYPERAFTERLFKTGLIDKVAFNCKKIFEPNDIKWLKQNYWLSFNTLDNRYENKITL